MKVNKYTANSSDYSTFKMKVDKYKANSSDYSTLKRKVDKYKANSSDYSTLKRKTEFKICAAFLLTCGGVLFCSVETTRPKKIPGLNPVYPSFRKDLSNAESSSEESLCYSPVGSVAFVKTHKTGSTTLGHIMNRFGYQRNLSFVLNKKRSNGHLGYSRITEKSPEKQFLKPLNATLGNYKQYKYDLITVHIRYNRQAMDSFMKPNTRYITIIRDPGTQFESAFVHFQFDDAFPPDIKDKLKSAKTDDRLREWFRNSTVYLQNLKEKKWEGQKGLRYFYAQNNQIFDLGLDVQYHTNKSLVREYISRLDSELDMVLITEYFEESLLVMKKQFCWQLEDILFLSKNQRSEKAKNYSVSTSLRHQIRGWNSVDYQLYQHFNSTLWRKVKDYGEKFTQDLQEFRQTLNEVFENCTNGFYYRGQGHYFQNVNFKPAKNSSELCLLIAEHKSSLMSKVRKRQVKDLSPVGINATNRNVNIT